MSSINLIIEELTKDKIILISHLADWHFSNWFLVKWENNNYFLRKFKDNIDWYEYKHDEYRWFQNSHYSLSQIKDIKTYWVFEFQWNIYHLQEYLNGKVISLDDLNEITIKKIAEKIAKQHLEWRSKVEIFSNDKKRRLYTRSCREYITNFEGILPLYESNLLENNFFEDYFPNVIKTFFSYIKNNRFNKLTTLHWDFWFWNILKNEDNLYFIDYSIIPFWEPGIDIGRFVADLELWGLFGNKETLQQYKKIFLETYIKITNDESINNFLLLCYQIKGLKILSPLVQKHLKWDNKQISIVQKRLIELTNSNS